MKLNDRGQCPNCLVKPISYRRPARHFCHRCCRAFDMDGDQMENWAWITTGNGAFIPNYPTHDYPNAKPSLAALRRVL